MAAGQEADRRLQDHEQRRHRRRRNEARHLLADPGRTDLQLLEVLPRERASRKGVFDAAAGTTTYTFTAALPADATGTWTISADIRRNVTLKRGDGKADIAIQESTINPIKYVAVTGTGHAAPHRRHDRRSAISATTRSRLHGGQRHNIEECVICHNPTESESGAAPGEPTDQPESVSFQRMIHRIHTGEELTQDFTVFGIRRSRPTTSTKSASPATAATARSATPARRYTLPLQQTDIASVTTLRDYFTPQGPGHRGLPRLPRQQGCRRARVPEHGHLPRRDDPRRGVRNMPRHGQGLGGRKGARAVARSEGDGRSP